MQVEIVETELVLPDTGPKRAEGLHLTTIIRSLEEEVLGVSYKGRSWGEGERICMDTGFLFEDALSHVLGERMATRLDEEVERDGILGSPDGIRFDEWALEEYKCTWKSSARAVEENWAWMVQIKSYLWMIRDMFVCYLRVLYLNGNYKGSGPQYRCFKLTFDEVELRANWDMIVKQARAKGWL